MDDIKTLAARYSVDQYVTVFEAKNLPNPGAMLRFFQKKYPQTKFTKSQ